MDVTAASLSEIPQYKSTPSTSLSNPNPEQIAIVDDIIVVVKVSDSTKGIMSAAWRGALGNTVCNASKEVGGVIGEKTLSSLARSPLQQ